MTASCAAGFLLAEGVVRLAPTGTRIATESAPRLTQGADFRPLLMPDPDPDVLFRLRPDLDVSFLGERVLTTPEGFRGRPLRDSSCRVVGIGDSVTFGWGVGNEDTFLHLLERPLEHLDGGVQSVNMGTPAYNTAQEVSLLARHVERLRPRWVVIGITDNDSQPSSPLQVAGPLARHSYLYRLLQLRINGVAGRRERSWRPVLQSLDRLGQLSRQWGFRVVAFVYSSVAIEAPGAGTGMTADLPRHRMDAPDSRGWRYVAGGYALPHVVRQCKKNGFLVADLQPMLQDAIARGEIRRFTDIWLSAVPPVDPHPSRLGHRIIARGIATAIEEAEAAGAEPVGEAGHPVAP